MMMFLTIFIIISGTFLIFYHEYHNYKKKKNKLRFHEYKKVIHDLDKEFFCFHCAQFKPKEEIEKDYEVRGINYIRLTPVGSSYICKECVKNGLDPRIIELLEERADRIIKWREAKNKISGDYYSI